VAPHVFVDESKERGYFVAAAVVLPQNLVASRQAVRALVLPHQRRIHFSSERDSRRHQIVDTNLNLGARAMIYDATSRPDPKRARDACLTQLVADLAEIGAERLVLEREDAALHSDNALLYAQVRATGVQRTLRYDHMRAHEEVLLCIPDAIAWCRARGGHWRTRIQAVVDRVRRV